MKGKALADLLHGWAITVHRAQGSEFPAVVVVLPPEASAMLSRPLVYTALTRAQKHLSIVHAVGPAVARGAADRHRAAPHPARPTAAGVRADGLIVSLMARWIMLSGDRTLAAMTIEVHTENGVGRRRRGRPNPGEEPGRVA